MEEELFEKIKGLIEHWKERNGYDCPFDYITLQDLIKINAMKHNKWYDHEVKMFIRNEDCLSKLPKGELFLLVNDKMVKMEDIK